ncbi:MAG: glycosyltransferase family 2 protein [Sedimenticola sp.]
MAGSASFSNNGFRAAILVPVFDHEDAIEETLSNLLTYRHDVLLVDDGSGPPCQEVLTSLSERHSGRVRLLRLPQNSGKGAAVKAGMRMLLEGGYTHTLQIDADGQHNHEDLPAFIAAASSNPDTMITGYPDYDESVPRVRLYGRYLTHIWVWINTLSFAVKDTMCGFRVYPLARTVEQLEQERCGDRMDFDTEVMVRWIWRGGKVLNLPTKVRYPQDGVSHFDALHDNVLISLMHTRLFFGMLYRLPGIIMRRLGSDAG